ncbi:MAG: tetratricopeptide repeat-containing sensor histidine kinase [Bacteroidales bacterium]|nr:tetratricopeptide repeat-containing sensor histidine kinase [Bacteroidales bacterium]
MIRAFSLIMVFVLYIGYTFSNQQIDSLTYSISTGSFSEKIDAMQKLAKIHKTNNSWKEAELIYEKALVYFDSISILTEEKYLIKSEIMLDLASIYLVYSAKYSSSLDLLIKVKKKAENSNDTTLLIRANYILGLNYRFLEEYKKSLDNLNTSIHYSRANNDTISLISAINEKANVYLYCSDLEESENLRLEALKLARQIKYSFGINYVSNDLALLFVEKGEYNKALEYFLLVYKYGKEIDSKRYICVSAINMADVYVKLKEYDSALYYYKISGNIAQKLGLRDINLEVYQSLSELYNLKGEYRNAYHHQKKYLGLKDSIYNSEKEKQIAEISTKYESEKKEKENKMLKQQNTIQELKLEKGESKFLYALIIAGIIVVFIIVIASVLYKSNLRKKRTNKELKRKNEQITLQKDQLIETLHSLSKREKELEEANITKDKFFSIIAHDIKNPFSSILGFSKLLKEDIDNLNRKEQKKYAEIISESSENLFKLLENLLQWSRAQTNKIEFNPEIFNLPDLLFSNIGIYKNAAIRKEIKIITDFNSRVEVFADKGMADVVIRNLLSNAIKFTKKKGRIEISVIENIDNVQIGIIDNGVGIKQSEIAKLFRIDSMVKSAGTENEMGTGLGLNICKEFVKRNKGEIWVESLENNGSRFFFTLPKIKRVLS